jgi:hypothetical protein
MQSPRARSSASSCVLCSPAQNSVRPYVLPPEVSANRVALKSEIDMTYLPPERLEQLIASLYRTPPDLIETVKRLVPNLQ